MSVSPTRSNEKSGVDTEAINVKHDTVAAIKAVDDEFGITPEERKRIVRHVDRRLVLTVGALYCVSLMDRTNLGAANIAGMKVDLALTGNNHYVSRLAR